MCERVLRKLFCSLFVRGGEPQIEEYFEIAQAYSLATTGRLAIVCDRRRLPVVSSDKKHASPSNAELCQSVSLPHHLPVRCEKMKEERFVD